MTQLSKEQIDKLFDFVRSKYVPHIDVVYTIFLLLTYFTTIAFYTLVIAVVIFGFISTWKLRYIVKGESHNEDDKYLVVSIFKGWAMTFTALPVLVSQYFSNFEWVHNFSDSDKLQIVIFSFLLSINIIWNVMAFYRFPALISNVLNEKYNHLNLEIKLNSD